MENIEQVALALVLLTPDETARWIGCSSQTLASWRSTGRIELPFCKIGRLVRYRREDVIEFLRKRTTTTTPGGAVAKAGK